MIIFSKLPYYISSVLDMILGVKNPLALMGNIFGRAGELQFKNGLKITTSQPLDILIAKETILDDTYHLKTLKNPKRIIDVGGAMGDFSLYCHHLFPKAKIIAFDPNPASQELFLKNVLANDAQKHITLYPYAVGTKRKATFYIAKYNVRSSFIKDSYSKKRITVLCKRLDDYITKQTDLLKIDCEGAEIPILESISSEKFPLIKKMILEYHNHLVKSQDKKITKYLKKRGFEIKQEPDPYNKHIGYIIASSVRE